MNCPDEGDGIEFDLDDMPRPAMPQQEDIMMSDGASKAIMFSIASILFASMIRSRMGLVILVLLAIGIYVFAMNNKDKVRSWWLCEDEDKDDHD